MLVRSQKRDKNFKEQKTMYEIYRKGVGAKMVCQNIKLWHDATNNVGVNHISLFMLCFQCIWLNIFNSFSVLCITLRMPTETEEWKKLTLRCRSWTAQAKQNKKANHFPQYDLEHISITFKENIRNHTEVLDVTNRELRNCN